MLQSQSNITDSTREQIKSQLPQQEDIHRSLNRNQDNTSIEDRNNNIYCKYTYGQKTITIKSKEQPHKNVTIKIDTQDSNVESVTTLNDAVAYTLHDIFNRHKENKVITWHTVKTKWVNKVLIVIPETWETTIFTEFNDHINM